MIDENDINEVIKYYRNIAFKEMSLRAPPRPRTNKGIKLSSILYSIKRDWFKKIDSNDTDYVYAFRLLRFSMDWFGRAVPYITSREAGYHLGLRLVDNSIVRNVDDMMKIFIESRIGLLDIIKESVNNMKIHIYECITCSGIPNIGKCVCDFEAGVLSGMLEKLVARNIVRERYCWGRGYSFCGFDVYFV